MTHSPFSVLSTLEPTYPAKSILERKRVPFLNHTLKILENFFQICLGDVFELILLLKMVGSAIAVFCYASSHRSETSVALN